MEAKRLGRKIKEKRKEHGLTSEKLADKCFINEGYVRQLESGKKIPSMPLLIRMCEILEIIYWILWRIMTTRNS